jgi:hypothetical protein
MSILSNLSKSLLGLAGKTPQKYDGKTKINPKALQQSQLDLDGKTPQKYLDNLPK